MKTYILFFIISTALFSGCSKEKNNNRLRRPNIILLIADDAGYGDLGCYGQKKFATPNIDRMAAGGMLFTDHYAGSTVCAPSRSSLMTGLHTGHTFIRGNREVKPEGQYPIPSEMQLLPEYLKEAGYVTGGFGKWGLGAPGTEGDPVNQGFDEWYGYNCQRLAHNYYPEYLWHNRDTVFLHANDGGREGAYSYDLIHEKSLEFIDHHHNEPFFLFLPYTIPHAELLVPDDSIFKYFLDRFPEEPYVGVDEGPDFRKGPYGSQEYPHAAFAAMMTRLDMAVGDILDKIDALGIADQTVFLFTSDNGPHMEGGADPDFFNSNGPFRGYKRDLYEGGIRVPMIIRWSGTIKPGSSTDHVSAFWDILPTVCDMAGISLTAETDGISFLPTLITQGSQPKHEYLYWEFYEQGGKQAVRSGKWKGIRTGVIENRNAPIALYDIETDPGENVDLAARYPEISGRMDSLMNAAHRPSEVFTW